MNVAGKKLLLLILFTCSLASARDLFPTTVFYDSGGSSKPASGLIDLDENANGKHDLTYRIEGASYATEISHDVLLRWIEYEKNIEKVFLMRSTSETEKTFYSYYMVGFYQEDAESLQLSVVITQAEWAAISHNDTHLLTQPHVTGALMTEPLLTEYGFKSVPREGVSHHNFILPLNYRALGIAVHVLDIKFKMIGTTPVPYARVVSAADIHDGEGRMRLGEREVVAYELPFTLISSVPAWRFHSHSTSGISSYPDFLQLEDLAPVSLRKFRIVSDSTPETVLTVARNRLAQIDCRRRLAEMSDAQQP